MASIALSRETAPAPAASALAGLPQDGLVSLSSAQLADPDFVAQWDQLAQHATEPNPFYESWYLLPSLAALDPHGRIAVLCLFHNGQLVGLMPVQRNVRYYGNPVPHLSGWVHPNCFLGTPLIAQGFEEAYCEALLAFADAQAGAALFLHLPQIAADGPLADALRKVLAMQGRLAGVVLEQERAMLASDLSPEDYFTASMSSKKRKELRRQHNRLSEEGVLEFHRQQDANDVQGWAEKFLALEASGWKGRERCALACAPATRTLFLDAMNGAAQRGRLERLSLTLDGRPIAMLANFIAAPGTYSYKTAFDEAYARYSPGVLLQRENLAILEREEIAWSDSCAAADHPMIERIWRETRPIICANIAIGGGLRRTLFKQLLRKESGGSPKGL